MEGLIDDLRQSAVVMRNEILKFYRGRKSTVYLGLVALVIVLVTFLPYVLGDGLPDNAGETFSTYISFASLLVVLAATLFSSNAIVCEFEERTALIIFTRPIKRWSVFLGKFLSCFLIEAAVLVAYYLVAYIVAWAVSGDVVSSFLPSLAMCLAYLFGCTGVALTISSLFRKGSTSAVVTFVLVLIILPVVSAAISSSGTDPWFMLDSAASAITNSVPEYVDMSNAAIIQIGEMTGLDVSGMLIEYADTVKSGAVTLAWGLVTSIAAYIIFRRREF